MTNTVLSLEYKTPEVKDRIRDWVLLHCSTLDEVETAIKDKTFIHSHLVRGVKRMIEKKATSDMCLEIWCSTTLSSVWVSIRLEEAENALQKILDYRIAEEWYEECEEIAQLQRAVRELVREVEDRQESPGAAKLRVF